jgi:cyclohexanone monooxygenase
MSSKPEETPMSKLESELTSDLEFDLAALRKKYREERDKRIRGDGEQQFIHTTAEYAHFKDVDPFAEPLVREPISIETEVLIMGGGFAGLSAAARLIEAGFQNLRVIEDAADFGGTWYWNRYPGAQCDIDSYCYLPLLEETGYMPVEKYSFAPEIYEHAQRIAKHYGLYDKAIFQTAVTALNWDDANQVWKVSTNRGDDIKARFVISGSGPGAIPRLPGIPGIQEFQGRSFHTSRWDFDYTGGENSGNLHMLANKRVAVIGTGASAVQVVPHLGEHAEHLYVFQRTPSALNPRNNAPTDSEWAKSLEPGWQRVRQANFNDVVAGIPFEQDLVNDSWTDMFRNLQSSLISSSADTDGVSPEKIAILAEIVDARKQNGVRDSIDATIKDSQTAEVLKPWYRTFCKRPCFNDEYIAAFNRDNVSLIDTSNAKGVEKITANGIVANGVEYPVDCIIYATGFELSSGFQHRMTYEVNGRDGRSLFDCWAKGRRTLHGHSTHGIPNWFFIGSSQVGISVNYTSMLDDQARLIAYILEQAKTKGAKVVEATAEGEAAWVKEIQDTAMDAQDFFEDCTPGYYNNEGKREEAVTTFTGDGYGPGMNAFNALIEEWVEQGDCKGLKFS